MNTNLTKILIFFLLFISSFSINAQTGNTCSDAIIISHSDTATAKQYYFANNIKWFKFIATNLSMEFDVCNENIDSVYLYSGDCRNKNQINQSNSNILDYNNLNIGQQYYLKVKANTTNFNSYAVLSKSWNYHLGYELDCSASVFTECNKTTNYDFTNGSFSFQNGEDIDAFDNNKVSGWIGHNHVDLIEGTGNENIASLNFSSTGCG